MDTPNNEDLQDNMKCETTHSTDDMALYSSLPSSSIIDESVDGTIVNTDYPYKGFSQIDYVPKTKSIAGNVNAQSQTVKRFMRKYLCKFCQYSSIQKTSMNIHLEMTHFNPREPSKKTCRIPCMYCEEKVRNEQEMKRHLNLMHPDVKLLNCEHCTFSTNCKKTMSRHILTVHDRNNPSHEIFKCVECPYETNCSAHLFSHIKRKHGQNCPYPCNICKTQSPDFKQWKQHRLMFHSKTVQELFPCDICKYLCSSKNALSSHMARRHHSAEDKFILVRNSMMDLT